MTLEQVEEQQLKEEEQNILRELQNKLYNVDENRHIDLKTTLDVKPRSLLIKPDKPDLKARMPSIFSQNSNSLIASDSTRAKLNKDAT